MELEILPFTGVGPIRFGMSRHEVRGLLGNEFREFRKTPNAKSTTDDYFNLHLHVYYDENDCCKAVEMFKGSRPTYDNQVLIGQPFGLLRDRLRTMDESIEFTDSGMRSRRLGISIYCPDADDNPHALVEAVYVFRRGIFGT